MKLPEDKKERTQILVLIAFSVVGVIYVAITYGIKPMLKKKEQNIAAIADLQKKVDVAHEAIKKMRVDRKENFKTVSSLIEKTDQYVIRPTLGGNYLLGVTKVVKDLATKHGIPEPGIRQVGHNPVLQNKRRSTPNAFMMYTISVTVGCGTHKLVPFLKDLEASNPYLSVSKLSINSGKEKKDIHGITFEVSWPRWVNNSKYTMLKEQLAKEKEARAKEKDTEKGTEEEK